MEIFEMLSDKEKRMMTSYISAYALHDGCTNPASIEHILRIWASAKSDYLFPMFNENLILSKEISFKKDISELVAEMEHAMYVWDTNGAIYNFIHNYERDIIEKYIDIYGHDSMHSYEVHALSELIRPKILVTNTFEGKTFELNMPGFKKPFKINNGAKVTRVLGHLAELCGVEGYEEFRIAHSQILNQKALHGTLCLSIHPFDYMTMSDNDSGWSSCMSWQEGGCYRQGTVEMMNSPCVVVAYLRGSEDMTIPGGFNYTWNNKKWRELFIVTPEMISNVKGYPYKNSYLSSAVLDWLKELAENMKYSKYDDTITPYTAWSDFELHGHTAHIDPATNLMYNDFNEQLAYFANDPGRLAHYYINYSGDSECMCCGDINVDFGSEGSLVAECCDEHYTCDNCGIYMYNEEDVFYIDDQCLCRDCVDNDCDYDVINEELHLNTNLVNIHMAVDEGFYRYDTIRIYRYDLEDPDIMKRYFKRIYRTTNGDRYVCKFFVKLNDCTEEGLRLFNYESPEDVKNRSKYDYYENFRTTDFKKCENLDDFVSYWEFSNSFVDFDTVKVII